MIWLAWVIVTTLIALGWEAFIFLAGPGIILFLWHTLLLPVFLLCGFKHIKKEWDGDLRFRSKYRKVP